MYKVHTCISVNLKGLLASGRGDEQSAEKSLLHVQVAITSIALEVSDWVQEMRASEPQARYKYLFDISPNPPPHNKSQNESGQHTNEIYLSATQDWKDISSSSSLSN